MILFHKQSEKAIIASEECRANKAAHMTVCRSSTMILTTLAGSPAVKILENPELKMDSGAEKGKQTTSHRTNF